MFAQLHSTRKQPSDVLRALRSAAVLLVFVGAFVVGSQAAPMTADDPGQAVTAPQSQDDPPTGDKKPAESAQKKDKPAKSMERDALIELIRARAAAAKAKRDKAAAAHPTTRPAAGASMSGGVKAHTKPYTGAQQPGGATARPAPAKTGKGCGSAGGKLDLTPLPPDQPQPKLVCKEPKVVGDPVWQGEKATFAFKIDNEGEGPLNVQVKGG